MLWAAVALGCVLRLRQYFFNSALWLDEAMLALHLTTKSAAELLHPLAEPLQIAPPGFLLATAWLRTWVPGPVEQSSIARWSMRKPPASSSALHFL